MTYLQVMEPGWEWLQPARTTALDVIMMLMFITGIASFVVLLFIMRRNKPCPRCRAALPAAAKFCGRCGLGVGEKWEEHKVPDKLKIVSAVPGQGKYIALRKA